MDQGQFRRGKGHKRQPEYCPVSTLAAAGSCAIESAVAALHQPGQGIGAITAAGEGIQTGERPVGADLEHRAIALTVLIGGRATGSGRSVKTPVAALR